MSDPPPSRYRVVFAKTAHMRFTGHLDLQRTWERLLRRSEVPLYFTQGFHPRPKFNFASALPLGFTGEAEIFELNLTEALPPDALAERLSAHAPPGIRIDAVETVPPGSPAVQTQVEAAEFVAVSLDGCDAADVGARCSALLASESRPRERRGKPYDLRPLVESLSAEDADGRVRLAMTLRAKEGATGRPDEVLLALELDPARFEITRVRLRLSGVD